ncbi:MAG: hypothetical protein LBR51_03275 [Bacteroidales bacterium]|nr:hypothetical protein [Bacteroidales bacterium]
MKNVLPFCKNIVKKMVLLAMILPVFLDMYAQSIPPDRPPEEWKGITADFITADKLNHIYLVKGSTVYKFPFVAHQAPHDLSRSLSYTYFSAGNITSIDVSNPMKIMLFYQESGVIVFLDDHLSPVSSPLVLTEQQMPSISLATYTSDSKIWLYDFVNNDMIQLDHYLKPTQRVHYRFESFNPIQFKEIYGRQLMLQDTGRGLYLFDTFGTYNKTLPVISRFPVLAAGHSFYYLKENELYVYNDLTLKEEHFSLPVPGVIQCLNIQNSWVFLTEKGSIFVW